MHNYCDVIYTGGLLKLQVKLPVHYFALVIRQLFLPWCHYYSFPSTTCILLWPFGLLSERVRYI